MLCWNRARPIPFVTASGISDGSYIVIAGQRGYHTSLNVAFPCQDQPNKVTEIE